jgi:DNA-binding transcriptional ArsR family regulator
MDSALATAARALSGGDPLAALKLIALRGDAPSLALRGIAMAQLGELSAARRLLRRAAAEFGDADPLGRARSVVAQAEVALALRDLEALEAELEGAARLLARRGDRANGALARLVQVRRLLLLGEIDEASRALERTSLERVPSRLVALAGLVSAELAVKRTDHAAAARALSRARAAALASRVPALLAEVIGAERQLTAPIARLLLDGAEHTISLAELPELMASERLLVDGCRREARFGKRVVSLVKRPVLLELLLVLAERAPSDAPRELLIARAFGARKPNESHRARLRVEIGRLRQLLRGLSELRATAAGFALVPQGGARVLVLLPPAPGEASALWSLIRGGEAWRASALAAALGKSQRAVQRALAELEQAGKVRAVGGGRARRWVAAPSAGIATTLLLVAPGTLG